MFVKYCIAFKAPSFTAPSPAGKFGIKHPLSQCRELGDTFNNGAAAANDAAPGDLSTAGKISPVDFDMVASINSFKRFLFTVVEGDLTGAFVVNLDRRTGD